MDSLYNMTILHCFRWVTDIHLATAFELVIFVSITVTYFKHWIHFFSSQFSLQKNESSIPSTETPVIFNKSIQPPKSQHDDAYDKSHYSEIVIFDDAAQDVSKTPDHESCFETVSCIKNLNKSMFIILFWVYKHILIDFTTIWNKIRLKPFW